MADGLPHLNFPPLVSHDRYIQRLCEIAAEAPPAPELILAEGGAVLAQLRAVNRATNAATREHKLRTAEARLAMDGTHLGLQNLMYERRHFEKEIEKCNQFASIYQDIPLLPIDEFLRVAPEEAAAPYAQQDEHQTMLNRLAFELAERQRLDEQRKKLTQQRDELLKDNSDQQTKLDTINSQIEAFSKAGTETLAKVTELVPMLSSDDSSARIDDIVPTESPSS